jgi:ribosome small subunit-dependent GTPase A
MASRERPNRLSRRENKRSRRAREIQAMGLSSSERKDMVRQRARGQSGAAGVNEVDGETKSIEAGEWIVSNISRSSITLLDPADNTTTVVDLSAPELPKSDQFAVGDWVHVQYDGETIQNVLRAERRTSLVRFRVDPSRRRGGTEQVLAANVDVVVIVCPESGVKPRLIDRYIVLAEYGGVEPMICINKIDRWDDPNEEIAKLQSVLHPYNDLDVTIIFVSALRGDNMHLLRSALDGRTAVFSGLSGVGKSSLVNSLYGREVLPTGSTRSSDDRGRHTTTSSSVVSLGSNTYVIDTPGIRQLENLQRDKPVQLRNYFREIRELQTGCRFNDCIHIPEPGCAVKPEVLKALGFYQIEDDSHPLLSYQRYESYLRLADPESSIRRAAEERALADGAPVEPFPWVVAGDSTLKPGESHSIERGGHNPRRPVRHGDSSDS